MTSEVKLAELDAELELRTTQLAIARKALQGIADYRGDSGYSDDVHPYDIADEALELLGCPHVWDTVANRYCLICGDPKE